MTYINKNKMGTKIQNRVMKRVYFIWFFRRILPYVALEVLIFGVFLYFVGEHAFVRVIVDNSIQKMLFSPNSLLPYVFDAALNTKLVVQVSLLGALAAMLLAFRNVLYAFIQLNVFKEETNLKRGVFY